MNTINRVLLLGAAAGALALNACGTNPNSASSAPGTVNEAVANSPRYLEKHPETRQGLMSAEAAQAEDAQAEKQHAKLMENSARANSPRHLEKHPEMLRVTTSAEESRAEDIQRQKQLAKLMENRAWANSPRAREEYPEIAYLSAAASEKPIVAVAPLK